MTIVVQYILTTVSLPHSPLSWIAVMSHEGKSSCFHKSDFKDTLMSMTALGVLSIFQCGVGYISVQSFNANVYLLSSMASFCSTMILIPFVTSSLLLRMLC